MAYTLLATDIDDTLLAHDGSIPHDNIRALQALMYDGVTIVFSSGRATNSILRVAQSIVTPTDQVYILAYNGGRLSTALSDTVLWEQLVDPTTIAVLSDYARTHQLHLQGYEGNSFLVEAVATNYRELSQGYASATQMEWEVVEDLARRLPHGSPKMLLIGDQHTEHHASEIRQRLGAQIEVAPSKPGYLEIVPRGVTKGSALTALAQYLGITMEETVAVGDSLNDMEMVKAAGVGVAVANARAELIEVANVLLTRSASEGALWEVAQRFFGV